MGVIMMGLSDTSWPAVSIGAIIFAIYASTAAPTIVGGDAGELVAEGCGLGTAHPPGYPFYTLIVHFVTMWLPDIADCKAACRVNLLCSAFGGAAAAVLADCIATCVLHVRTPFSKVEVEPTKWEHVSAWVCGCCGAGLWAFSPLVWQYAVTAEVFSLNNLLVSLVVRQAIRFAVNGGTMFDASFGAFLVGLSLTNQHTALLFAFPITIWVLACIASRFTSNSDTISGLIRLGVFGLIGLSSYAYLPIASRISPHPGSWGFVQELNGFWHHFIRADYGSIQLYSGGSGSEGPLDRTQLWFEDFVNRQSPKVLTLSPVIWLVTIGCLNLLFSPLWVEISDSDKTIEKPTNFGKTSKKKAKMHQKTQQNTTTESTLSRARNFTSSLGPLLVFILVFYIAVFHYLSNMPLDNPLLFGIHARFWQQPNWIMGLLCGVGLHCLCMLFMAIIHSRMLRNIFKEDFIASINTVITLLTFIVASYLVLTQMWNNLEVSDQSSNHFFEGYAKSVLSALPDQSIILINYDQQWTSSRYFQVCEGVAPGVTIINLSMMSFAWWQHKRILYPQIKWPGTHYTGEGSDSHRKGGFTFEEFVASNLHQFSGGIYLGGSLSFKQESWTSRYEMIPFGILNRVVPLPHIAESPSIRPLHKWEEATSKAWEVILDSLPLLPTLPGYDTKYSEETWEWTIGREFLDHLGDYGAYLLEQTLEQPDHKDFNIRLLTACAWFELQINLDPILKTSTLKNVGLGYMHLVKGASSIPDGVPPRVIPLLSWAQNYDLVYQSAIRKHPHSRHQNATQNLVVEETSEGWKSWCSNRFIWSWGEFLKRPDAVQDSSYNTIKSIYETVSKVASKNVASDSQREGEKKILKKRKKKKSI